MVQVEASDFAINDPKTDPSAFRYELLTAASVAAAAGLEGLAQAYIRLAETETVRHKGLVKK
jgi:hypothetical protein